jgi:hypothetical protein
MEAALGQMLAQADRHEEAKVHLEAALRAPSRRAADLPWTYFFLGQVALALDDDALLEEVRRSIVAADALAGGTGAPEALQGVIAGQ